ncbi:MAG: GTP-binding protein [Acidobacteriota bacterium]
MSDRRGPWFPTVVVVGGFLGAGKTSLIVKSAEILQRRGLVAAAIMNDQSDGLVDTGYAAARRVPVSEVAGGCFCCRFSDLLDAAGELRAVRPDVIFAEPVGSCIDVAATVIRPLQIHHGDRFRVAPLTVLFDPALAARVAAGSVNGSVEYLFRNQIAEADVVCASKGDVYPVPRRPAPDFVLSAKTGAGVEPWLDQICGAGQHAGGRLLDVDYAEYGAAEATLGWLNVRAAAELRAAASPAALLGPLLDDLDQRLSSEGAIIAHLKLFDQTRSGYLKAGISGNGELPGLDGDLLGEPERLHELTLNLRAVADPPRLEAIVRSSLAALPGRVELRSVSAFRPAQPVPQYRT